MSGSDWVQNNYGEWVHSKVRRFIAVREGPNFCSAVPVTSYSGQGVAKPGVKKSDHAIVYSGTYPPKATRAEQPTRRRRDALQPQPIAMDMESNQKLDDMSRVNLAQLHTIHHYVKVKNVAMVAQRSMPDLISQFKYVLLNDESVAHGR